MHDGYSTKELKQKHREGNALTRTVKQEFHTEYRCLSTAFNYSEKKAQTRKFTVNGNAAETEGAFWVVIRTLGSNSSPHEATRTTDRGGPVREL